MDEIKVLKKKLDKWYWDHKQVFHIASIEVMDRDRSGPYSFYVVDENTGNHEIYLFDICTYASYYEDVPRIDKSILYPEKFDYKVRWDGIKAASSVFYHARERLYTLPKFTAITDDDIIRCTRHFGRKALDGFWFNYRLYKHEEQKIADGVTEIDEATLRGDV